MGLRAWASDLRVLFEEAALALADISADRPPADSDSGAAVSGDVRLEAPDLVGLAFAWLNDLIGLADLHGPLAGAEVFEIGEEAGAWRVHGRARFAPTARARIDVKSATYHRLAVERTGGVWTLSAVLDV